MDLGLLALYVGPDQVMPVMSILATIAGFFLIFWNKILGLFRRILGMKRSSEPAVNVTVNNEVRVGQPDAGNSASGAVAEPPKQQ